MLANVPKGANKAVNAIKVKCHLKNAAVASVLQGKIGEQETVGPCVGVGVWVRRSLRSVDFDALF